MWQTYGIRIGRGLLYLLTFIHLVLPWTPANQSDRSTILVGAIAIGLALLGLSLWSRSRPRPAITAGAAVFVLVEVVAHVTGASPIEEGWPVKLVLTVLFAFALAAAWSARAGR